MSAVRRAVRSALLIISGALMAVALMPPAHAQIVAGKDLNEGWDFVLDGRDWTVGAVGSFHEYARREYVLKTEDTEKFSEKITTLRYPKAPAESIDTYIATIQDGIAECEGAKLTIIEADSYSVMYERNIRNRCDSLPVQTEIGKMVFKNGAARSFSYMKKVPELGTIPRNQWVELVKFATPK